MDREKLVQFIKGQTARYAGYPVISDGGKKITSEKSGFVIGAFLTHHGRGTRLVTSINEPIIGAIYGDNNHSGHIINDVRSYEPIPQDEIETKLTEKILESFEKEVIIII